MRQKKKTAAKPTKPFDRVRFLSFLSTPQYPSIFCTSTIKFPKKLAETNSKLKICEGRKAEKWGDNDENDGVWDFRSITKTVAFSFLSVFISHNPSGCRIRFFFFFFIFGQNVDRRITANCINIVSLMEDWKHVNHEHLQRYSLQINECRRNSRTNHAVWMCASPVT